MALRLSESHQPPASMGVGAKGIARVGSFEQDTQPVVEETALGKTYNGHAGLVELEFPAIGGLKSKVADAVRMASSFRDVLRFEVWQDSEAGWGPLGDRYRVRIWVRGEYAEGQGQVSKQDVVTQSYAQGVGILPVIPLIFLGKIILLLGFAALVGIILWKISRTTWGKAAVGLATNPLVIGIGVGVLALMLLKRKGYG